MYKLKVAAACALLVGTTTLAVAAESRTFPTKPIRLVLPFPPGGGTDAVARVMIPKLTEALGQPVVLDNRPGAAGNIAAELVAKAPPDGHTLFMAFSTVMTVNKSLYANLAFDPVKDFAPIVQLAKSQYMLAVHPSLPVKSVAELVKLAKSRPGALNYASSGLGGPLHLAAELLKHRADIKMVHLPYKGGGPAVTALLTGEAHLAFVSLASSLGHLKAGRLRGIAVSGLERSPIVPNLPTLHQAGYPNFNVTAWHSFCAPAGTPQDIIARLNAVTVEALRAPDTVKLIEKIGYEITATTPEQLAKVIRTESELWARLIEAADIRAN